MMRDRVNLLNEVGMLANTPRSGFAFLGTGQQSVAEHSYRVTIISLVLADLCTEKVDREKLMMLCLLHDLPEARTGDLNYVNKKYVAADTKKAIEEIGGDLPLGKEMRVHMADYEAGMSLEATLAHDADKLELLLVLKQESDTGNPRALRWFDNVYQRLKTPEAKQLADEISQTPSDEWWLT